MPTLYGSSTRIDLADGVLVAMADDTTVAVRPSTTAPQRADAADVAQVERSVAEITRQRDGAHQLALAATLERDQRTSELGIARGENERLREEIRARASAIDALAAGHAPDFAALADRLDGCALHALRRIADRLDAQPTHRAAGDGVDLAAAVAHEAHCMEWGGAR